jgi:hypothetical protein
MARSYNLYYKGKPLNKFLYDYVYEFAKLRKIDADNPKELYKYYQGEKELFAELFEMGVDIYPEGTPQVIKKLNKEDKLGKTFILDEGGIKKELDYNEVVYKITKTEMIINDILDTTGFIISYRYNINGEIIVTLPVKEDIEYLEMITSSKEEPDEIFSLANDFLSQFGITVYGSDPKKSKNKKRTKKRKEYYKKTSSLYSEIAKINKNDNKNDKQRRK